MMKKYLGFVAISAFLFSCAEIERDNQYDMRAGDNYIPKEGSSSSVVSSSSSVEPSSSSALPSSSSGAESSSSTAPSSSSAVLSSSSVLQSSSSVVPSSSSAVPCTTASNNTSTHYCSEGTMKAYGSVADNDGKTYKTVVIGTQTWMAENLNYRTSDGTSRCYPTSGSSNPNDDNNANCDKYGRLYNWSTAMDINASFNENKWGGSDVKHKGICPSGWHIPSDAELDVLVTFAGGSDQAVTKLKAASEWNDYEDTSGNGTNDYGFSALPGGYVSTNGYFYSVGDNGSWWSATESNNSGGGAYMWQIRNNYSSVYRGSHYKSVLYSVRCVQD